MRVLLTTDTIGGVWTFTKELTTGLLQLGHNVALVSFGGASSEEQAGWCSSMRADYGSAFRYDASSAPLEWMPANGEAYTAAVPLLRTVADEFSPDILHANQFCFGGLPLSIPKVITAHSDVLSWAAACRSAGLEPSEWIAQYHRLVQDGLDGADAVVAPTQWMLDALGKNFRISGSKRVILNGRSLAAGDGAERRMLQAVCAGRLWDEAKNVAMLSEVRAPFPILLAGDGRPENIAASRLGANIALPGKLDEAELLALFRSSSIYLATSIYEPFGLAPLEAALCGCAVVANDIPSFREVWGEAAMYFSGVEALSRILEKLYDTPALLERFRRSAIQRALQLTRSRMVDSYLALYSDPPLHRLQTSAYEPATYA